jgi:hypothetical protein
MSDINGVCFVRRGSTLVPADFHADEFLNTLQEGKEVILSSRRARSPQHHRWVFALLRKVVENTEGLWANEADLLDDLKEATGMVVRRQNPLTGSWHVGSRSISFAAMDENSFRSWRDRALDILSQRLGWDVTELMKEVDETQKPMRYK